MKKTEQKMDQLGCNIEVTFATTNEVRDAKK